MRIQRDQIIATALVLLDETGLEGLTMRALAQVLRVQAPSLYWHFPNKKALIDGMRLSGRFRTNDSDGLVAVLPTILPLATEQRTDGSVALRLR